MSVPKLKVKLEFAAISARLRELKLLEVEPCPPPWRPTNWGWGWSCCDSTTATI